MGQYYLTVNVTKRQFLDPHKFGGGLKLCEFSGAADGLPQALVLLLSSGNGRGGGDIRADDCDPKKLIGSWAGDQVIVAGDYMDEWLFVPEDLKGKEYTDEEGFPHSRTEVTHRFGFREVKNEPGEYYGETLYSAARAFFTDISDEIIKVVGEAESPYHPWAAMDISDNGWRHPPEAGVLPLKDPKTPAAGFEVYQKYKDHSVSPEQSMIDDVTFFAKRHPERAEALFKAMRKAMRKPRAKKK
jgi:hypothetical protein